MLAVTTRPRRRSDPGAPRSRHPAGFLRLRADRLLAASRKLGLIAGVGMLIAFCCTLSFLPALLALFGAASGRAEAGLRLAAPFDRVLVRRRWPVLAAFAVLAVAGAVAAPKLTFDSDPLHTKNPDTEAMRTLAELIDDPRTSPYTMELLAPDFAATADWSWRASCPSCRREQVLACRSFVP